MCVATVNTRQSLYIRKCDPVIYLFIYFVIYLFIYIISAYICLIGHLQNIFVNVTQEITVGFCMHVYRVSQEECARLRECSLC